MDLTQQDTTELFLRFRDQHDHEAFEVLHRRVGRILRKYASRAMTDRSLTEDVVQTTLLIACRRADSFDPARATKGVVPWLWGIMTMVMRETTRSQERCPEGHRLHRRLQSVSRSPAELICGAEFVASVDEVIASSSETYREVLRMRLMLDLSPQEIAASLQSCSSTVRSQLNRGLAFVRSELRRRYSDAAPKEAEEGCAASESLLAALLHNST